MKSIIIDSGSIITLALNNLLWLLEKIRNSYSISFYITEPVKKELVDNPLATKKFKFEALQVLNLINKGVLEVVQDTVIDEKAYYLLSLANSCYSAKAHPMKIVHDAEMSTVAAAVLYNANAVMIDERTTRYLIERPEKLRYILSHKLHTKVDISKQSLIQLKNQAGNVKFIRSAEFVAIAFEKGLLNDYLPNIPESKETLLDALLWGLKLSGCAISTKDLEILKREELRYIKN